MPSEVADDVPDPIYPRLNNVASVDRIVTRGPYGLLSVVDHYHPSVGGERLVVYHEGHCDEDCGKRVVQFFVDHGYSVLVIFMPLYGPNWDTNFDFSGPRHEQIELLEREDPSVIRVFFEPVALAINYAVDRSGCTDIAMLGVSGGGWASTVYPALDPRVRISFPIAGSIPFELRIGQEFGDFEQLPARELYDIADFRDLYALAASGNRRKQVQVLNQHDPCCFFTEGREDEVRAYEQDVVDRLRRADLGGQFSVYVADHDGHSISAETLDMFLAVLE